MTAARTPTVVQLPTVPFEAGVVAPCVGSRLCLGSRLRIEHRDMLGYARSGPPSVSNPHFRQRWHPDVMAFINAKITEEKMAHALIEMGYDGSFNGDAYGSVAFQNVNQSVRADDAFMSMADDNEVERADYALRSPATGEVLGYIDPHEALLAIAEGTWFCGDPGMQFDDTINRWHTSKASGRINSRQTATAGNEARLSPRRQLATRCFSCNTAARRSSRVHAMPEAAASPRTNFPPLAPLRPPAATTGARACVTTVTSSADIGGRRGRHGLARMLGPRSAGPGNEDIPAIAGGAAAEVVAVAVPHRRIGDTRGGRAPRPERSGAWATEVHHALTNERRARRHAFRATPRTV